MTPLRGGDMVGSQLASCRYAGIEKFCTGHVICLGERSVTSKGVGDWPMIRYLSAFCVLWLASCTALAAQERNPNGVWLRDDGNARVRIARCGSNICATNLWIKDSSKGEEVGDRLVMSLDRKSDTTLAGSAYDPKRDRTYAITVIVNRASLTTRGCILGGVLCRDVGWTPVE